MLKYRRNSPETTASEDLMNEGWKNIGTKIEDMDEKKTTQAHCLHVMEKSDNSQFGPVLRVLERLELLEELQEPLDVRSLRWVRMSVWNAPLESSYIEMTAPFFTADRVSGVSSSLCPLIPSQTTPRIRLNLPQRSFQLHQLAASDNTSQASRKRKRDSTQIRSEIYHREQNQPENKSPTVASDTNHRSDLKRPSEVLCQSRDACRCIVTKCAGPIDVAHVVPVSLDNKDKREHFFTFMGPTNPKAAKPP
ncbi:hypothetical protein PAAG_11331 [Paracoccidioides lutzii Pb01]|uniref:HNH nuclease domain-containing protein n=1 Tax=Paracoccidioides lutzii (strain ATCC MYA-826 / Pb01) TaxID=502779 RepID=A0A0A2V743_PARBA|nr:hypothetical protein PAAG_11331 [Paracoccidioides lutzii Pb01]KGQ01940.1 hypothetical protein PAAG_11331 [Paracoccidioides lutzii Pb01]